MYTRHSKVLTPGTMPEAIRNGLSERKEEEEFRAAAGAPLRYTAHALSHAHSPEIRAVATSLMKKKARYRDQPGCRREEPSHCPA